jgi:hypothetical protein
MTELLGLRLLCTIGAEVLREMVWLLSRHNCASNVFNCSLLKLPGIVFSGRAWMTCMSCIDV